MSTEPTAALACMLLLAIAGSAAGAPAAPPTPVEGVIVPGGPAPKVTTSYPTAGGETPAGTLVLKVVFDQAMTPDGWSYGKSASGAFPQCLAKPRLLADQRTFVLLCRVLPHQTYAIEINAPTDFANQNGRSAKPTLLQFSTTDVGPRDLHDALIQAGLTDADDPIMTWRDDGAGVSRSSPHDATDPPG